MVFKKGPKPWNKGKKLGFIPKKAFKKGHIPWNKGMKGWAKGTNAGFQKNNKINLGRKFSKEHRENISLSQKGKKLSEEHKKNLSIAGKGIKKPWVRKRLKGKPSNNIGKHWKLSQDIREKMSMAKQNISEETKKKMRISAFNYVKKRGNILYPCIGHNEKQILDNLERKIGHKIIRQYEVEGYFIDGYIQRLNLVIEIDEKPKNKPKDIKRQKIIEKKLNCKFIRIKDYD